MNNVYGSIIFLFLPYVISVASETWYPRADPATLTNHSVLFRPVIDPSFHIKITTVVNAGLKAQLDTELIGHLFQWLFITGFRESSTRKAGAWIVIGGFVPRRNVTSSEPFVAEATGIVGCRLNTSDISGPAFQFTTCHPLQISLVSNSDTSRNASVTLRNGLLGMGLSSLQLKGPADGAVLVYCDPLWRAADLHPSGMCRIRLRQNGTWLTVHTTSETSELVQFCTVSEHSRPCGGGFSVDLLQHDPTTNGNGIQQHDGMPRVDMLVGLPFAQPNGEVQLFRNVLLNFNRGHLKHATLSSSVRILGNDKNFGSTVKWLSSLGEKEPNWLTSQSNVSVLTQSFSVGALVPETLAVVSSPSGTNGSGIFAYRLSGEQVFHLDPSTVHTDIQAGLGQSVAIVRLPPPPISKFAYALVTGSPFETSPDKGPNTGRVYIRCPTSSDANPSPPISGPYANGFFGYSVARVGDVDGDGIHDVAIGAPGLQATTDLRSTVPGRVYIHRVTAACTLDPAPIQVLEASDSQPGDGFGLNLADDVDIDYDGWPELLTTSLRSGAAPYVFTMPRRLVAQCQISFPLSHTLSQFQPGTVIPVQILVRLFDPRLKQWVTVPLGLVSEMARVHQVNPDVLWQQRPSPNQELTTDEYPRNSLSPFLMGITLNQSEPRFLLVPGSIQPKILPHDPHQLSVKFDLQSQYGSQNSELITIPLRVAYRSVVNAQTCPNFSADEPMCSKVQQPLVDWSQCVSDLQLARHICIPAPECIANLVLSRHESYDSSTAASVSDNLVRFQWGRATDRHQTVHISLTNKGPTKSTGLRVQVRVAGRSTTEPPGGINLYLTRVSVLRSPTGTSEIEQSDKNMLKTNKWTINLHPEGVAALISSKSHEWMYPNETMLMRIDLYAQIAAESQRVPLLSADELTSNEHFDVADFAPSLHIHVLSATKDPNPEDDQLSVPYGLLYEPRIDISAGSQPPTLIDNRKEPTLFHQKLQGRRVVSDDIGPKIKHTFLIENTGKFSLSNVTFMLDVPIATSDGQPLIYLSRQSRRRSFASTDLAFTWQPVLPRIIAGDGTQRGSCSVPEDVLDPFQLMILDLEDKSFPATRQNADNLQRSKRHYDSDIVISRVDQWTDHDHQRDSASDETYHPQASFERRKRGRIQLRCPHTAVETEFGELQGTPRGPEDSVKCTSIHCRLDRLEQHDTVRLEWVGWLWSETYFNLHTPDVQLVSRLRVQHWGDLPPVVANYRLAQSIRPDLPEIVRLDFPKIAPSYEMVQSIVFRAVQPEHRHMVPWWPIIVGVVVGCLLLMALGVCCYYSGFFRRKSLHQRLRDKEAKQQKKHLTSEAEAPLLPEEQDKKAARGSPQRHKKFTSSVQHTTTGTATESTPITNDDLSKHVHKSNATQSDQS